MALTGKQKAAMLLMNLDAATAAELVKDLDAKVVQEIAVELAYLDASGFRSGRQNDEIVRQFCNSLQANEEFHLNRFLNEMLSSTVGNEKTKQIQNQIQDLLNQRDPFISIRVASPQMIATILESEHPQAAAVVLSELPEKISSEVLSLMSEDTRLSAIQRMTSCEIPTAEARSRIAETICRRLEDISTDGPGKALVVRREQSLRKVAVILRNLGQELRDGLLIAIKGKDNEVSETVASLMIVWADIPQVTDRSLQEALRGIDTRKLALALYKSEEVITEKIRSNISERAVAALDEEVSLMSAPKKEDVENAREDIIQVLREMNKKGEIAFVEE